MTNGAWVEIDQAKMTRDQLVLMGMKEFADKWIETLNDQIEGQTSFFAAEILRGVVAKVTEHRDTIAVVLTEAAVKSGSARIHNAPKLEV
ncbi:MAG: hypothetical protein AB7U76_24985 [Pirellulales bacterium]